MVVVSSQVDSKLVVVLGGDYRKKLAHVFFLSLWLLFRLYEEVGTIPRSIFMKGFSLKQQALYQTAFTL